MRASIERHILYLGFIHQSLVRNIFNNIFVFNLQINIVDISRNIVIISNAVVVETTKCFVKGFPQSKIFSVKISRFVQHLQFTELIYWRIHII